MLMNEVANGLDASPSSGRFAEQAPSHLGQQIGFAIPASQEERQGLLRKLLHLVLMGVCSHNIRLTRVIHDCVR